MAIRKITRQERVAQEEEESFEKDVFAVDFEGNISEVILRKETFRVVDKERQIILLDSEIERLTERKDKLQVDIEQANAVE